jgi:hypothetical protein
MGGQACGHPVHERSDCGGHEIALRMDERDASLQS